MPTSFFYATEILAFIDPESWVYCCIPSEQIPQMFCDDAVHVRCSLLEAVFPSPATSPARLPQDHLMLWHKPSNLMSFYPQGEQVTLPPRTRSLTESTVAGLVLCADTLWACACGRCGTGCWKAWGTRVCARTLVLALAPPCECCISCVCRSNHAAVNDVARTLVYRKVGQKHWSWQPLPACKCCISCVRKSKHAAANDATRVAPACTDPPCSCVRARRSPRRSPRRGHRRGRPWRAAPAVPLSETCPVHPPAELLSLIVYVLQNLCHGSVPTAAMIGTE